LKDNGDIFKKSLGLIAPRGAFPTPVGDVSGVVLQKYTVRDPETIRGEQNMSLPHTHHFRYTKRLPGPKTRSYTHLRAHETSV
ncbi:hypothetical protein ACVGWB_00100, partial [Enterobacter mori]